MNELYIPAPTRNAAALTVHTPRMRIIVMSTSGSAAACSLRIQTRSSTAVAANRPTMRASPQPQAEPSLMPISRQTSHAESRKAPSQLTRPGVLIGDSGTKKIVAIVATTVSTNGIQNSQ